MLADLGEGCQRKHPPVPGARRGASPRVTGLTDVFAGRRNIEQKIDQMIFKQVGFIDVKEPAMRAGQQSRLECLLAARQRPFQIERADNAVLPYWMTKQD